MADPAVVASQPGSSTSNAAPGAVSISGTGANCLVVFVAWRAGSGQTLNAVTYNSVSMTQVFNVSDGSVLTGGGLACFRLVNPASGSNDVATSWSANPAASATVAIMLSDVDTTTPVNASGTAAQNANYDLVTVDVASATGGLVLGAGCWRGGSDAGLTLTLGAGQTGIATVSSGATYDDIRLATSYEAGAATVTTSWTYAPALSYDGGIGSVALNAGAGGASSILKQMLLNH